MMRYLAVLLGALGLGLLPCSAGAQDSPFVYHRDVGSSITIAWTHDKVCPSGYSFSSFQFRGIKDGTTDIKLQGQTQELQVPIQAAFEGQLFYEVRAACSNGTLFEYSSYASSKDPTTATVDGAPRGWLVSYDLRPPTEVVIEPRP